MVAFYPSVPPGKVDDMVMKDSERILDLYSKFDGGKVESVTQKPKKKPESDVKKCGACGRWLMRLGDQWFDGDPGYLMRPHKCRVKQDK